MDEIKQTGTLKTYKVIIVRPGEKYPDGYLPITDVEIDEQEVYIIAVPEGLLEKIALLEKLEFQAICCLIKALNRPIFITWGDY